MLPHYRICALFVALPDTRAVPRQVLLGPRHLHRTKDTGKHVAPKFLHTGDD